MDRVMPSTINYADVLPLSIPAIGKRQKFYPNNGATFNFGTTRQIRIEIGSTNALLDPTHSYLGFEVANTGAQTFGPDIGGSHNFFENVRIEQGGKVLSDVQQCHKLHNAILTPCQMSSDGQATEGVKGSVRQYNSGAAASTAVNANGGNAIRYGGSIHNNQAYFAAGAGHRFTMSITSGLFGQNKLIPLPLINPNEPLTLVLDLVNPRDVGCWNGVPGANDVDIRAIHYIGHMVEVGGDVINQFRGVQEMLGGQLAISGQDWSYAADVLPNGSTGQQLMRCPIRKRSIKSMFWCAQSNDLANTAGPLGNLALIYNSSYAGCANVDSWQIKSGAVVHPVEPINGIGNSALVGAPFRRGESVMELAKAFGTLGYSNPTGILNAVTYSTRAIGGVGDGDNGAAGATEAPVSASTTCVCPNGVSLEAWAREATESGLDTETFGMDTNLLLNVNAVGSGAEDKIIHMWVLYDQHYYFNKDGSVTYSN